jgi:hypothetical protein
MRHGRAWYLLVVIGGIVLGWIWRSQLEARPAARAQQPAAGTPHPAAAMSLEQAYAAAETLVESRRSVESLPYFRRMAELVFPDDWALHHDYANALQGASLESRQLRGFAMPATRSSVERIELALLAQSELDRAAALARSPAEQAAVHLTRARQLGIWGLAWDAFSQVQAATDADPAWALAPQGAVEWAHRMESVYRAAGWRSRPTRASRPHSPAPRGRR